MPEKMPCSITDGPQYEDTLLDALIDIAGWREGWREDEDRDTTKGMDDDE